MWIEEAEEIGEKEFTTLDDTLRTIKGRIRIVLSLNTPPKNHVIIKKWFNLTPHAGGPRFLCPVALPDVKDAIYIPGTWRENEPNLDPATIERYKGYKQTKPAYYWQVIEGPFTRNTARGKIFTGWQQIDTVPEGARLVRFGEDFGWYPDPACAVAIYYWNGAYVIDELAYGTELTNEFLAGEIKAAGDATTVADSAEPKSIAEQNGYGISVIGAAKGRDSVNFRIKVASTEDFRDRAQQERLGSLRELRAWAEGTKMETRKGKPAQRGRMRWMWSLTRSLTCITRAPTRCRRIKPRMMKRSTTKSASSMEKEEQKPPEKPRTIPGRGKEHYDHTEEQPISPPLYPQLNI